MMIVQGPSNDKEVMDVNAIVFVHTIFVLQYMAALDPQYDIHYYHPLRGMVCFFLFCSAVS